MFHDLFHRFSDITVRGQVSLDDLHFALLAPDLGLANSSGQLNISHSLNRRLLHYVRYSLAHQMKCRFAPIYWSKRGSEFLCRQVTINPKGLDQADVLMGPVLMADPGELSLPRESSLLNGIVDAILVAEADLGDVKTSKIVYANDSFLRTAELDKADAVGKVPWFLTESLGPAELKRLALAMFAGRPVRFEAQRKTEKFEVVWSPVTDETGWNTYWVAVQRSLTDRPVSLVPD